MLFDHGFCMGVFRLQFNKGNLMLRLRRRTSDGMEVWLSSTF